MYNLKFKIYNFLTLAHLGSDIGDTESVTNIGVLWCSIELIEMGDHGMDTSFVCCTSASDVFLHLGRSDIIERSTMRDRMHH